MEFIGYFLSGADWRAVLFMLVRVSLLIVGGWLGVKMIGIAMHRMESTLVVKGRDVGELPSEAEKRAGTLVRLLRQLLVTVIAVTVFLVILREIGVDVAPILASAGIVGLAVGFGAQNLVRDVIAGFFMILENQVRVGDVAIVNGTGGMVEKIGFRTIILRDLSGTVYVFPNGTVTSLANVTRDWSAYVFEIAIAYKEDTDRVIRIMREAGSELKVDPRFGVHMLEDVDIFGVDNFATSAVIIKGRIKTRPSKQWEVGREFRRRVKIAFDREGVDIPFTQRFSPLGDEWLPLLAQLAAARLPKDRDAKTASDPAAQKG